MTIQELKHKWEKEKHHYETQEIGSGVHSFIKNFLESEDLFSIREGSLSTKSESRRNEYIHEKKAKEKRKADFVIYINSDVIIPVEAESYGNIEAGVKQLFNYQSDFDKQYGILTDGHAWRFYNNNIYREFSLDQILSETDAFLEFWREYIKPEFYYLSFFEPQGQLALLKESDKLPVERHRQLFFDDITALIKSFKNKLKIEGYFKDVEQKERDKKAVEITYAYIIQFILYKTLVDNKFGKFSEEFKEINQAIYECLKQKQYGKILGIIEGISNKISENVYRPFKSEQQFITDILLDLIRQPKNELKDVSPWLDIFVFIKKYDFANVRNEIFGFIYENYLKELFEETKKGQYFTDPAVVNFMLDLVGYESRRLKNTLYFSRDVSIVDPACGCGTFLYSAADRLIKVTGYETERVSQKVEEIISQSIFGLDIAEFPLYLAEMNILMRMLPMILHEKYNNPVNQKIKVFLTKDSIAEFSNTNIKNTLNDLEVEYHKNGGQMSLFQKAVTLSYQSFVREESDLEEMKRSLENHKQLRRRFDFVVGNPPYISYNECSKQKILSFELMKKKEIKLNDIYGVNLHSIPDKPKSYRPNPNLYAFFLALGVALLKDNGKLCYIIPQTILVNPDLDVIRYHLVKYTTIERIVTFSGKMFIDRGLNQKKPVPTSSLIIVVKRAKPELTHEVEITNYKGKDDDLEKVFANIAADKKTERKFILQANLLSNVSNWNFIKQDKKFLNFMKDYKQNTEDICIYYNYVWAEQKFKSKFYFDGGYSIDEKLLLDKESLDNESYVVPKLNNKFWLIIEKEGFWPNIRKKGDKRFIDLRQGNQGYNFLDSKYKIIWSYNKTDRFFFTDKPVIWARNKILGIGSDNKKEVLYLFSLLNSGITDLLLQNMAKIEHETTRTILVSLQIIKDLIRVPKINKENQEIKDEIIKRAKQMLALEDITLADLVDFGDVLQQKFKGVAISNGKLTLMSADKNITCEITGDRRLINQTIDNAFENKKQSLFNEEKMISLGQLKSTPAIDFEKQNKLKDYIDDLIFALYFNIPLLDVGPNKAKEIKEMCSKNKYYGLVNNLMK